MTTNEIRSVFRCTLTLITPLHVGTGEKLRQGFDFLQQGRRIHVIDSARMFAAVEKLGREAINAFTLAIEEQKLGEWLPKNGIPLESIASHSISLNDPKPPQAILPHIRDGMATPIIPGSSLKGALRTAIIRKLATDGGAHLLKKTIADLSDPKKPRPRAKEADKHLLQNILGKTPNINLMRVLTVGDFSFPRQRLGLQAAVVYRLDSPKGTRLTPKRMPPIWVEKLPDKATSNGMVSFDDYLAKACHGKTKYLDSHDTIGLQWLLDACRNLTSHTMTTELAFLKDKQNSPVDELRTFYGKTLPAEIARLSANEVIIQMAWGSGWRGMTGQLLTPADLTTEVRGKLELATKYLTFPFPKSRRLAENGQQVLPMGWVKLSFTPMAEVREEEREKQRQLSLDEQKRQATVAEEEALTIQWQGMDQAERDLACVRQLAIALKFAPADANEPNQTIWKRFEQTPIEHKRQLALAFKERWQREGRWEVKNKKGKQFEKITMVKAILAT